MKDVVIYGAGGFGRETACLLCAINKKEQVWNFIGFIDDVKNVGDENGYGKVLGGIDYLNSYSQELNVVIAIGSPHGVASIVSKICNDNIVFPNIIHPDINIVDPKTFRIGKGNIIQGGCSISCDVTIGDFNVFNGSIALGHDDNIGNYNSFMPAIRVSGAVTVGNCNFFGVGSIILQQIKIGNDIRLGAGSVLMTKPKDGNLYMGNPAKKMIF